jgi:hypothetical protein
MNDKWIDLGSAVSPIPGNWWFRPPAYDDLARLGAGLLRLDTAGFGSFAAITAVSDIASLGGRALGFTCRDHRGRRYRAELITEPTPHLVFRPLR